MKWWKRFCRHVTFPALFGRSLHPASNCSNGQRFLLLDSRFFFSRRLEFFFCLDSNFKISNRVCSHDICLVFFRSWTYILQISTHVFYCIRCILQVSTYVLRFQHVFTIGIILSATERHSRLYGRHCSTRDFVFNAYPGRDATCPLSGCSNKNDGPRGRFNITVFLPFLVKDPFV